MQLSKLDCRYGAPLGRRNSFVPTPQKLHLAQVVLDSGGYDSGGAYWGIRIPRSYQRIDGYTVRVVPRLFRCWSDDGNFEVFVDAVSRADAKADVLTRFPKATFYR